jgi:signal transduction histidine kinase
MTRSILRFIVSGCLFFIFFPPVFAQYQIRHYTTENGLPSNGITGLQWDNKTGFLWVGTEAGLVRYNGMGFKTFDIASNPEFGSNRIFFMVKNAAGKILVAGQNGNLSLVKNNKVSFYFNGSKQAKDNYNHYAALAASDTVFRQWFKIPWTKDVEFIYINVVPVSDTSCLAISAGKLFYYSVSMPKPVPVISAPSFVKTLFAENGHVYFYDHRKRLFSYNSSRDEYKEEVLVDANGDEFFLKDENSRIFWQPGMESPILLQDGNAWLMETDNANRLRARLIVTGVPANVRFSFAQYVKEGDYLFLGTASKGIYVIQKNQLTTKQPAEMNIDEPNSFYSQVELENGNIITEQGIIIGDNPSRNDYNLGTGFLKSVYFSGDSVLIYAKKDSVYRYNRKTYTRRLLFSIPINYNFPVVASGGRLYFANKSGIAVINENRGFDFIKKIDENTTEHFTPFDMVETEPGKLVLATCDGLFRFDIKTKDLDTLLQLKTICIRSLHKEGAYLFIGTYGAGYYVMKNNKLKPMPLDINQYLKYAHCFMTDEAGYCWISSNNGLFKVKVSDITDAFETDRQQIYYHWLGKDDGMQTNEMNGGCTPCAIRLTNRNFSFPTMDGLVWFNPEKINIALPSGEIYMDKLMVDGKQEYVADKDISQLPRQVKKIDITLVTNAWCKKENLYLDYKLNDDNWLPVEMVSGEPRVSFNNLSYGKHVLLVRKLNGFGTSNYSSLTFTFRIATPFYHQWWFRVLAALAVIGLLSLIFWMRLRRFRIRDQKLSALVAQKTKDLNLKNIELEKNDQIKTRLISIINHDIITPLKFMHYAGNVLVENKGVITPEEQLQTITEITQAAKGMEMLSAQILNWIIYQNPNERMQKEEFDLHQLVDIIIRVLQFPAKQKNVTLQNNVPSNFVIYQYLEPARVMIYNLILNGLNFTREGSVSVQCHAGKDQVVIQVTDTGLGMTKEQIDNLMSDEKIIASANVDNKKGTGLGYMIINDLLKMMDGSLSIRSTKNTGTEISVSLPVK